MNHRLENFIHHSWKQKSHTSQKCKVGPMDVTWLGSPPGGFSNLLAWLETRQQVSFTRVEGVKRSQGLISSCEIPQREMAALHWWRGGWKFIPFQGLVLSIQWSTFMGSILSRLGEPWSLTHLLFCGQRKGWSLCFSWGKAWMATQCSTPHWENGN